MCIYIYNAYSHRRFLIIIVVTVWGALHNKEPYCVVTIPPLASGPWPFLVQVAASLSRSIPEPPGARATGEKGAS